MSNLRVLVCEDIHLWSDIIPERIVDADGSIDFHQCFTVGELITLLDDNWDAILLDNWLPLTREIDDRFFQQAVAAASLITTKLGRGRPYRILWTSSADDLLAYSFVAYGGHDYLDKNQATRPELVSAAVRRVDAGHRWIPDHAKKLDEEDDRLIRRWLRLLALLAEGLHADAIAEILGSTPATISSTVGRIAAALGIERSDGSYSTLVPAAAQRAGYLWVPYRLWQLDPDNAPWPGELPRAPRARKA